MSRSRHQHQLSLPPVEVRKSDRSEVAVRSSDNGTRTGTAIRNSDNDATVVRNTDESAFYAVAARLLETALDDKRNGMTRDEVAYLLGVSRSLVDKWCSPTAPNCPSQIQLLRLPVSFQLAYRKALDDHFGHRGHALRRLADLVGDLALAEGL